MLYEVEREDVDPVYTATVTDANGAAQLGLPDGVVATVYRCTVRHITQPVMAALLNACVDGRPLPWDERVPVRRYIGQPGDGPNLGNEGHGEGES
ncbi:MAG: hypothetical protein AMXMBFR64_60780 [Myxococcales bacterium]